MNKYLITLLILISASASSFAQQEQSSSGFDKSRLFAGGNFALSFGTYTLVNVSPQVGYHFTDMFAAGVGINYIYYNYRIYNADGSLAGRDIYSYAGMNVFGRVYPIRQMFLQAQPELNYVWGKTEDYNDHITASLKGQFVPSLLLGGGAAIPAGRGAIMISVMYDVLQNNLSPYYHQAVFGFGYVMGF